jgi:hypothetical protein
MEARLRLFSPVEFMGIHNESGTRRYQSGNCFMAGRRRHDGITKTNLGGYMFKNEVASSLLKIVTASIQFEDLSRYLPFQTRIVSGETFNHIQSQTAYDVKTYGKAVCPTSPWSSRPEYTVSEGDTLCRRNSVILFTRGGVMDENCPGCTAIAQGIIKRDIEQA